MQFNGERLSFEQIVLEVPDIYMQENELRQDLYTFLKILTQSGSQTSYGSSLPVSSDETYSSSGFILNIFPPRKQFSFGQKWTLITPTFKNIISWVFSDNVP